MSLHSNFREKLALETYVGMVKVETRRTVAAGLVRIPVPTAKSPLKIDVRAQNLSLTALWS